MTEWEKPGKTSDLQKLGTLTIRLVKLMTYEKLARAQAQFKAQGIKTNFLNQFKAHALDGTQKTGPNESDTDNRNASGDT